ncbi:hypothetical protein Pan216_37740 [Planctomycetes bacterium Pan216]|uniref:Positive regulator of sigma(E), RseC/MucC n=1 Tax=Kolteria novifilia TaxID=2527975 RepID=A0A518B7G2_9BACT|nr:hypothetical protein Pan216_37740 [Planctomycetes bacterium Pan216]
MLDDSEQIDPKESEQLAGWGCVLLYLLGMPVLLGVIGIATGILEAIIEGKIHRYTIMTGVGIFVVGTVVFYWFGRGSRRIVVLVHTWRDRRNASK